MLVFDIWQESSANMLPEYEIQTSNKLRVMVQTYEKRLLSQTVNEIKKIINEI